MAALTDTSQNEKHSFRTRLFKCILIISAMVISIFYILSRFFFQAKQPDQEIDELHLYGDNISNFMKETFTVNENSKNAQWKDFAAKHGEDTAKIIENNFQNLFVENSDKKSVTVKELTLKFDKILKGEIQFGPVLDLSSLMLRSIPDFVLSRMANVEKLTLSNNPLLKFEHEWLKKMPKANIKTLVCENNSLTNNLVDDIDVFSEFPNLKSLTIKPSSKKSIKTSSRGIVQILEKLTHLDISECESVSEVLIDCIFNNCKNLKSLHFKHIPLKSYFSSLPQKIVNATNTGQFYLSKSKNLESLDLVDCSLDHSCLKDNFPNLKKIDLSENKLENSTPEILENLFKKSENSNSFVSPSLNTLEEIVINQIHLQSARFIRELLDLEKLNSLTALESFTKFAHSFEDLYDPLFSQNQIKPDNPDENPLTDLFILQSANNNGCPTNCRSASSLKNLAITCLEVEDAEKFMTFLHQFEVLESLDVSRSLFPSFDNSFSFGPMVNTLTSLKFNQSKYSSSKLCLTVLKAIDQCNKLKNLEAENCDFSGLTKNVVFKNLNSLESISFANCNLKAILEWKNVKRLNISSNNLSNFQLSSLSPYSSLEELDICSTQINSQQLNYFFSLFPALKEIKIGANNFKDAPDDFAISNVPKSLTKVFCQNSTMNTPFFIVLTHLPLRGLVKINESNLSIGSDTKLGTGIHSLTHLEVCNSDINYSFFKAISVSKSLKSLLLCSSTFVPSTDTNLQIENFGPALETLTLENVTNNDDILPILRNFVRLEFLSIFADSKKANEQFINEQFIRLKSMNPNLYTQVVMMHYLIKN